MNRADLDLLADLVRTLERLDAKAVKQCVIADHPQEAVLLGTPDGLISLSMTLLRLALDEASGAPRSDRQSQDGLRWTDAVKAVFFEFGEVWPVCAMAAPDVPTYEKTIADWANAGALTDPNVRDCLPVFGESQTPRRDE